MKLSKLDLNPITSIMSIFYHSPSLSTSNQQQPQQQQQLNLVITPDLPPDSSLLSSINYDNNQQSVVSSSSELNNHDMNNSSASQQVTTKSCNSINSQRKPFKTEYKSKFTPFDQYVYNEVTDSFVKPSSDLSSSNISSSRSNQNLAGLCSPRHELSTTITSPSSQHNPTIVSTQEADIFEPSNSHASDTCQEPWYKEVVKRNEKANEYRFKSEIGHNSPLLNYNSDQQQFKSSSNTNVDRLTSPSIGYGASESLYLVMDGMNSNPVNMSDIRSTPSSADNAGVETVVDSTSKQPQYRFTPNDYKRDHLIAHMANNNNFALPKDQQPETKSNASAAARRAMGTTSSARPATRSAAQIRSRSQSSRRQVTTSTKSTNQQQSTPVVKSQQSTPTRTPRTPIASSATASSKVTSTLRSTTTTNAKTTPNGTRSTTTTVRTTPTTIASKRITTVPRVTPKSTNASSTASNKLASSSPAGPATSSSKRLASTTPTTSARPTTGAGASRVTPKTATPKLNTSAVAPGKLPNGSLRGTTPSSASRAPTKSSSSSISKVTNRPTTSKKATSATTTGSGSSNGSPLNAVKSVKTPKAMEAAAKQAAEIAAVSAAAAAAGAVLVMGKEDEIKQTQLIEAQRPESLDKVVVESKAEEQFIIQPQQYVTEEPTNLIFTTTEGGNMLADELAEAEVVAAAKQNLIITDTSSKFYQEEKNDDGDKSREDISENLFDNSNKMIDNRDNKIDLLSYDDGKELKDTNEVSQSEENVVVDQATEEHVQNEPKNETIGEIKIESQFEQTSHFTEDDSSSESSQEVKHQEFYQDNNVNEKGQGRILLETDGDIERDIITTSNMTSENLIKSESKQEDFDMEISKSLEARLSIGEKNETLEENVKDKGYNISSDDEDKHNYINNNNDDQLVNGISGGLISAEDRFDSSEREMSSTDLMGNKDLVMPDAADSGQPRTYEIDQNPDDEPYSIMPTMSEPVLGQLNENKNVFDLIKDEDEDHDQQQQEQVSNLLVQEALNQELEKQDSKASSDEGNHDQRNEELVKNSIENTGSYSKDEEEHLIDDFEKPENKHEEELDDKKVINKTEINTSDLLKEIEPKFTSYAVDNHTEGRSDMKDFNRDYIDNMSEERKSITNSGDESSSSDTDNDLEFNRNELLMNVADLMGAESKIKQEMRRKSEIARQNSSPQPLIAPPGEVLLSAEHLVDRVSKDDLESSPSFSPSPLSAPRDFNSSHKVNENFTAYEQEKQQQHKQSITTIEEDDSEHENKEEKKPIDSVEKEIGNNRNIDEIMTIEETQKNVKLSSVDQDYGVDQIHISETTKPVSLSSTSSSEENLAREDKKQEFSKTEVSSSLSRAANLNSEVDDNSSSPLEQALENHQHLINNNQEDRESDDNEMMNTHTSNTNQSNDDDDMDNDEQLKLSNHLTNSEDELILEPRNFNYTSSSTIEKQREAQKSLDLDDDVNKNISTSSSTTARQSEAHTNDNSSLNLMTLDIDGIGDGVVEIGDGRSAAIETTPTIAEERVEMASKLSQGLIGNKIVPEISHTNYMFSRALTDDSDSEVMMVNSPTTIDEQIKTNDSTDKNNAFTTTTTNTTSDERP